MLKLIEYDRESTRSKEFANIAGELTINLNEYEGDGKPPSRGDTLEYFEYEFDPKKGEIKISFGYWTEDTRTRPHHYD